MSRKRRHYNHNNLSRIRINSTDFYPKLKIKSLGIDPNSRGVVTVVGSSFTGHLGNWAADHADEIFNLDIIDALTAYVRVSFPNMDLRV